MFLHYISTMKMKISSNDFSVTLFGTPRFIKAQNSLNENDSDLEIVLKYSVTPKKAILRVT